MYNFFIVGSPVDSQFQKDMIKYWPAVYSDKDNQKLWDNEWRMHGSCIYRSNPVENQRNYFKEALNIFLTFDRGVIDKACKAALQAGSDWKSCYLKLTPSLTFQYVTSSRAQY